MPRAEDMPLRGGMIPQFERFMQQTQESDGRGNSFSHMHHQGPAHPPTTMYSPPRTPSNGSSGSNLSSSSGGSSVLRVHSSQVAATNLFPSYDTTKMVKSPRKKKVQGGQTSKQMTTCTVCGDVAPEHVHYGSVTCFSCRAFFRRYVSQIGHFARQLRVQADESVRQTTSTFDNKAKS